MQSYTYNGQTIAPDRLAAEIRASSITIAYDHVETSGGDCIVWFKAALSTEEQVVLDAIIAAHSGLPLPEGALPVQLFLGTNAAKGDGTRIRVASEKPNTPFITIASHDWSDPTTWHQDAARVVDEVPIRLSARNFRLYHGNVIDVWHGKITQEDYLRDAAGNLFRVVVKLDGVTQTEDDPHVGEGSHDYHVHYETGEVHFNRDLSNDAVVLITYHYARTSVFTLRPSAGKILCINSVECQFSQDVVMNDTVIFQAYVYAPPQLGLPPGTKVPYGSPSIYKSMSDFENEASKSYPVYPPMGGSGWRGMNQGILVFSWDYISAKPLPASAGAEVRIKLQHDVPFGGYFATSTFYCTSEAE